MLTIRDIGLVTTLDEEVRASFKLSMRYEKPLSEAYLDSLFLGIIFPLVLPV